MSDNVSDLIGLAIVSLPLAAWLRARPRLLAQRPRLCSCGHGSGMHGLDGCRDEHARMVVDGVRLPKALVYSCRCTGFDGAGPRAPR